MSYDYLSELKDCTLCPRECHADRVKGRAGYCMAGSSFEISAICKHMGEEPVISGKNGICNVFFTHCNMQCIYCQNHQISKNRRKTIGKDMMLGDIVSKICAILDQGVNLLGFVSPSHFIPHVKAIIYALQEKNRSPVIVYNTNSFDRVETLKSLENLIDVYLPDFKYADNKLAIEYSDTPDYAETAIKALREMVRQKGTSIRLNDEGQAESGVIIRHLVLPGHVDNSIDALRLIAEEISPFVHVSLMSQYFPSPFAANHPLIGRTIFAEEYESVVKEMAALGLYRGWLQEYISHAHYRPDFFNDQPFA
jgi:putative pyruvate formate lyase activating enzyme